jgi:hypothetical protein
MDDIATPHDTYFRESFSRREVALDFLRAQLPAGLLAEIELDSLMIAKDSYVSRELRPSFSVEILESVLRYYVQGTGRLDEPEVRQLLQQTSTGDPIMQTFIDRYIEQGRQQGEAAVLLRQIERKFGTPSQAVRERVFSADAETLLNWSERILTAESVEAVLH